MTTSKSNKEIEPVEERFFSYVDLLKGNFTQLGALWRSACQGDTQALAQTSIVQDTIRHFLELIHQGEFERVPVLEQQRILVNFRHALESVDVAWSYVMRSAEIVYEQLQARATKTSPEIEQEAEELEKCAAAT